MQIVIRPPAPSGYMETVMFSKPSAEATMFMHQRNNEIDQRLIQHYGAAGQQFLNDSQAYVDNYRSNAGFEAAEQIILMSNNALTSNSGLLMPLETLQQLQEASGRWLPYLMANPTITTLYHQGRIDGYGELYFDQQPGVVGEMRNAYRAVVSGIGQSVYDEGFDPAADEVWITYSNDESDDGIPLKVQEQYNAINAWKIQNLAVDDNIDPSSIDGFEIRPK